jgi:regulator of replication initiation timing
VTTLEQANATLRTEKQKADTAYNSLLQKVNEIRKSLTTRFQQNEEQLAANSETIESLEQENQSLTQTISTLQTEISSLSSENSTLATQISSLRKETSHHTTQQSDWDRERTGLHKQKRSLEQEIDSLRLALSNWERTASEEHSLAEASRDRILLLEEEISSYRDHQDSARGELERYRDETVHLRNALRDVQDERKRELREVVEGMEGQIERLNLRSEEAEKRAVDAEVPLPPTGKMLTCVETIGRESTGTGPFKTLRSRSQRKSRPPRENPSRRSPPQTHYSYLIAVILNEHLTKALRLLKRASPSSTVDKLVMTNFLLQFLSLPREDTKRYEILNLIASLLEWNDEQRQKAGLARQTTSANFRRSNSNPMLHDIPASPGDRKEVPPKTVPQYRGFVLWIGLIVEYVGVVD